MECKNCNNPLKPNAKFCGKCGTKTEAASAPAASSNGNTCADCGNTLKPNAKFCGKCGKPQQATASTPSTAQQENKTKGYITWEMQPGQVALRLTENMFSQYSKALGVIIPEGYLAMIMVGGKMQSMMEAGVYKFDNKPARQTIGGAQGDDSILARVTGFFSRLLGSRVKKDPATNQKDTQVVEQAVNKRVPVEIIVCRSSDFSLPFTFKDVPTSTVKVDVGMLISIQVENLLELYKRFLVDKTVLPSETFAKEIIPYLENIVKASMVSMDPASIATHATLKTDMGLKVKDIFQTHFPYIAFNGIVKLETSREELQRLDRLKEEMYLSEQELEQLSRRNEFMNRLNQEQNSAELQNATNTADFNRRLAEINRDELLNQEEMTNLQRDIQERAQDHEINRTQALEMVVMQHQYDVQSAQIKMEEELGTRLFNLQLDRQRTQDDYADERRQKEMQMDKEEQLGQLDLLKQAQEIRQQREQAEHQRKMDEKIQDQTHEKERLNIYAGMSAEQIMVANPAITKEAANAMAEKFKAEAAAVANDSRAEDAKEQTRMMKEFMEQQMQAVRDMSASNAQAMSSAISSKEREIERTQQMADKNEDRYAGVVREKIKADSGKEQKKCKNCGPQPKEETFCPDCGSRMEE